MTIPPTRDDLLAPAGSAQTNGAGSDQVLNATQPVDLDLDLGLNLSPQPDDVPPVGQLTPLDEQAEQDAFASLLALIDKHKDAATVVKALDAAAFMRGIL